MCRALSLTPRNLCAAAGPEACLSFSADAARKLRHVPYKCGVAAPLLAVDTPSMLFRAFYALPSTIVGAGREAGQRAAGDGEPDPREVEIHRPRAVVLCFGPDAASYRTELYPAYHAEREEEMPDELAPQFAAAGTSSRPSAGPSRPATTSRPTTCSAPTPSARPRPAATPCC